VKIREIEAFQVARSPADNPAQRSAFVRVRTDDGLSGIGEASPMQGGLASLGIDPSPRTHAVFDNPPVPVDGLFRLSAEPGLGLRINEAEPATRRVPLR